MGYRIVRGVASNLAQSTSSSMASLVGIGGARKRKQINPVQHMAAHEDHPMMGHMDFGSEERPSNNSQAQSKAHSYFYYLSLFI